MFLYCQSVKNSVKLHGNKIKTVIFSTVSGCRVSICQSLVTFRYRTRLTFVELQQLQYVPCSAITRT